jgi:hypothetical protein
MSEQGNARVNYFDQQVLRLADFTDEQAYHLAMRRRHNLAGHTWGIVYGLQLELSPDGLPLVKAGLAADGYGREVILSGSIPIPTKAFDEKGSDSLDVFLAYAQQASDTSLEGFPPCTAETDAAYRRLEVGRLVLRRADEDPPTDSLALLPERRTPPEVPQTDLPADPTRLPPDDPAKVWPVFLGTTARQRGDKFTYTVDMSGRPYAGLVGEMIQAPSGRAWVQLGPDGNPTGDPTDDVFAVHLPAKPGEKSLPRLAIDRDGNLSLRAKSTINGDLLVDGGAVQFGAGSAYDRAKAWSIYQAQVNVENGDKALAETQNDLRIEMGSKGSPPTGHNRVSIGHWSDQENKWVPCLNIGDNCQVEIFGDLVAKTIMAEVQPGGLLVRKDLVEQGRLDEALKAIADTKIYKVSDFTRYEIERQLAAEAKDPKLPVEKPPIVENITPILKVVLSYLTGGLDADKLAFFNAMVEVVKGDKALQSALQGILKQAGGSAPPELPDRPKPLRRRGKSPDNKV